MKNNICSSFLGKGSDKLVDCECVCGDKHKAVVSQKHTELLCKNRFCLVILKRYNEVLYFTDTEHPESEEKRKSIVKEFFGERDYHVIVDQIFESWFKVASTVVKVHNTGDEYHCDLSSLKDGEQFAFCSLAKLLKETKSGKGEEKTNLFPLPSYGTDSFPFCVPSSEIYFKIKRVGDKMQVSWIKKYDDRFCNDFLFPCFFLLFIFKKDKS